jgi:hypothetical protein
MPPVVVSTPLPPVAGSNPELRVAGHPAWVIRAAMRLFLWGLVIAAAIYLLTQGHVLFLPLLFFIPLGGMFGRRRTRAYSRRW